MTAKDRKDLVEQAIARGETLEWIITHLDVTPRYVARVRRGMDEAVVEEDRPGGCRGPGAHVKPCGTYAAYQRHHRRREPIDQECRAAASTARRRQRARRAA